jgi:hypothetical protein
MVPGYLLDVAALAQGREAFTAGVFKRIHVTLEEWVLYIFHLFFFFFFPAELRILRLKVDHNSQIRQSSVKGKHVHWQHRDTYPPVSSNLWINTVHHLTLCRYQYFLKHKWDWDIDNVGRITSVMSEEDRKTFNLSMKDIHWPTMIEKVRVVVAVVVVVMVVAVVVRCVVWVGGWVGGGGGWSIWSSLGGLFIWLCCKLIADRIAALHASDCARD